jgi:transposase
VGASRGRRAGLGDRGLPPRVRAPRAVSGRPRRTRRPGLDAVDGDDAAFGAGARQVGLHRRAGGRPRCAGQGHQHVADRGARRPELDLRLLVDHRERLVRQRCAVNNTPQWNLHDLWPELELPGGALFSRKWSSRIGRRLARAEQTMRVRIARDELRRLRELTQAIAALEAEIAQLVAQVAPQLLAEPGFVPLTAAKLVGEIAGAGRFATDAKLARAAGLAPIPLSSGKTNRHRLDRGGNRQVNAAIHRVAVTRARCHPETRDYIARKRTEGKTHREAIRSLKRHLTRRVWQLLRAPTPARDDTLSLNIH